MHLHHIPELGVDVEEVPLMSRGCPVLHGMAGDDGLEAVGPGICGRGPHAGAGIVLVENQLARQRGQARV